MAIKRGILSQPLTSSTAPAPSFFALPINVGQSLCSGDTNAQNIAQSIGRHMRPARLTEFGTATAFRKRHAQNLTKHGGAMVLPRTHPMHSASHNILYKILAQDATVRISLSVIDIALIAVGHARNQRVSAGGKCQYCRLAVGKPARGY